MTNKERNFINQLLVEFISEDSQSINIIKSKSFKKFLSVLNPNYEVPCESTIQNLLEFGRQYTHQQLQHLINSDVFAASLTVDMWTARNQEGFVGVTCTWISKEFEFKEALILIKQINYPHTGEKICDILFDTIKNWKLESKITCITSDNGSNMIKAIRLLNSKINIFRIPCASHTLQLSVKKAFKLNEEIQRFILRCKRLISFFSSPKQMENLISAQNYLNYEKTYKTIKDVETRWNSTFYSLKCLNVLKDSIICLPPRLIMDRDSDNKKAGKLLNKILLSDEEWDLIPHIIKLLEPFEILTNKFGGKSYVTISLIYPHIYKLIESLKRPNSSEISADFLNEDLDDNEINPEANDNEVSVEVFDSNEHNNKKKTKLNISYPSDTTELEVKFQNALHDSLINYWSIPTSHGLLASLMDPRFKKLRFTNEEEKTRTIQSLRARYELMESLSSSTSAIPTPTPTATTSSLPSSPLPSPSPADNLFTKEKSIFDDIYALNEEIDIERDEVSRYLQLSEAGQYANPLQWWKDRKLEFPILSLLAKEYLGFCATSVPSERLFSDAGNQITSKRSNLNSSSLERLLFIKRNMNLVSVFPY